VARTPNIDRLAGKGVRFSHAFTTVSSCSPSRSVIYTGLYAHTSGQYGLAHGTHNFHSRAGVKSLPAYLRTAGYRTGIIGKTHIVPRTVYDFDEEIRATGRNGAEMAKQARKFIEGCGEKEFCLVMGYTDPHRAGKGTNFANRAHPGIEPVKFDPRNITVPPFLPDLPEVRADLVEYYRAVNRLDQGVGALLEVLKTTGRDRDTLVIFLSDNGIPFPGAKTTLYDSGIHLPLIVHRPGQKKTGVVNRAMTSWVDIVPTILHWAAVKAPPNLPGRSLLPILEEEQPKGWDQVFASHTFHEVTMYYPMRAIRTRKFKYIRNLAHKLEYPIAADLYDSATWQAILQHKERKLGQRSLNAFLHRPAEELYDLEKNPVETKNLAGDPAHARVLQQMRKQLRDMQEKTGDPWTVKYQHE
jgi:N-sulfoglucosamine sulfohydrolase